MRDLTLAEQADMIVAFRPFSHPDSSEEAGGVGREIQCILQKRSLGRETCRPCLLIIHPDEDERRRRENAFDETWRDENLDSLISGTPEQIESLRADLKRVIVSDLRTTDDSNIRAALLEVLEGTRVSFNTAEVQAMGAGALSNQLSARENLINKLLHDTLVLKSTLHSAAERDPDLVQIWQDDWALPALAKHVASVLTK